MMIKLGFVKPNLSIRHLLVDEAQDYTDAALRLLSAWFPKAEVTLLGDPNQRTLPGLPDCRPETWGATMGYEDAALINLSKGYRSSLEIAEFCNELLPEGSTIPQPFGRHGELPKMMGYSKDALAKQLDEWEKMGHKRVAVITRTQQEAVALSKVFKKAALLTGDVDELEESGVILSGINLMKGLEFDAVAVVWPESVELTDDERRRRYTACSRALHALTVFKT